MNCSRSAETAVSTGLVRTNHGLSQGFWMCLVLVFLLLVLMCLSLLIGSMPIDPQELISGLMRQGDQTIQHIVWQIRLPRVIGAVLSGAGLGLAGCALQNLMKNPLASPFTLGVSQGAVFGASFAIVVIGATKVPGSLEAMMDIGSSWLISGSAFLFSLLASGTVLLLAVFRGLSPQAVVLAGVALSSLFGAGTMMLRYFATDTEIAATVFWTFGDVGKFSWSDLAQLTFIVAVIWVWMQSRSSVMNAMVWGDEVASSLGVAVNRERVIGVVLATLTTATTTAFAGIIGFVGLIAPHTIRLLTENNYRLLVPFSALFGSVLLVLAELLGRTIAQPIALPVGILTSFAGAPLFLFLLVGRRDNKL